MPASAAGLLSEARLRATAASRESVPVDVMEDHMAMSRVAARQVLEVGELVRRVVAVELVCAAEALALVGVALAAAPARELCGQARAVIPVLDEDRLLDADLLVELVS